MNKRKYLIWEGILSVNVEDDLRERLRVSQTNSKQILKQRGVGIWMEKYLHNKVKRGYEYPYKIGYGATWADYENGRYGHICLDQIWSVCRNILETLKLI